MTIAYVLLNRSNKPVTLPDITGPMRLAPGAGIRITKPLSQMTAEQKRHGFPLYLRKMIRRGVLTIRRVRVNTNAVWFVAKL